MSENTWKIAAGVDPKKVDRFGRDLKKYHPLMIARLVQ